MQEIWKDIEGFEGLYQISNLGRVKSVERYRKSRGGCLCPVHEIIKAFKEYKGYYSVGLCKDHKVYWKSVHRLVAIAFIPNPNNYPVINHKDENTHNNRVENLEWCTLSYNTRYSMYKVSHKVEYNGIVYPSIRECSRQTSIGTHTIRKHIKAETPYNGFYFNRV